MGRSSSKSWSLFCKPPEQAAAAPRVGVRTTSQVSYSCKRVAASHLAGSIDEGRGLHDRSRGMSEMDSELTSATSDFARGNTTPSHGDLLRSCVGQKVSTDIRSPPSHKRLPDLVRVGAVRSELRRPCIAIEITQGTPSQKPIHSFFFAHRDLSSCPLSFHR